MMNTLPDNDPRRTTMQVVKINPNNDIQRELNDSHQLRSLIADGWRCVTALILQEERDGPMKVGFVLQPPPPTPPAPEPPPAPERLRPLLLSMMIVQVLITIAIVAALFVTNG